MFGEAFLKLETIRACLGAFVVTVDGMSIKEDDNEIGCNSNELQLIVT